MKETKRVFGLLRTLELTPREVGRLQRDTITQRYRPDILNGRINKNGSATIKGHLLSEDIAYIQDAAVEGDVFM